LSPTDNPLENNEKPRIRGWQVLVFAALLPALGLPVLLLFRPASAIATLTAVFVVMAVAFLAAVLPSGRAVWGLLGIRAAGWRWYVLGTLAVLACSLAATTLVGAQPQGMRDLGRTLRADGALLPALLALALLAPAVEELVFRGLLFGWLEGRWGGRVALVTSTLVFAAAHLEPMHVAMILPLGFVLGWMRLRSGSLLPPLIAHVANNAIAVSALYFGLG